MKKKIAFTELKALVKKMLLNEITQGKYPQRSKDSYVEKFTKALDSVLKGAKAVSNEFNPKITLQDGKAGDVFDVELYLVSPDKFNLVCITHGSDRKVARNLTEDEVVDFIKKDLKEVSDSYVAQAMKKGKAPYGEEKKDEKKKADKEEVEEDTMEEADEDKKQIDIEAGENEEREEEEFIKSTPGKVVDEDKIELTRDIKVSKPPKAPKVEKSPKKLTIDFTKNKKATSMPSELKKKGEKATPIPSEMKKQLKEHILKQIKEILAEK